jgi:hypothetical protein
MKKIFKSGIYYKKLNPRQMKIQLKKYKPTAKQLKSLKGKVYGKIAVKRYKDGYVSTLKKVVMKPKGLKYLGFGGIYKKR